MDQEHLPGRLGWLAALVDRVSDALEWSALAISFLLFLQWPLREWVQAGSREANDLGQVLFAFYVAAAVTAASRRHAHLAASGLAHRFPASTKRMLSAVCATAAIMPWSLFVIWATYPVVASSVATTERFAETGNPGYFLIKVAIVVLAVLMLAGAVLDIAGQTGRRAHQ